MTGVRPPARLRLSRDRTAPRNWPLRRVFAAGASVAAVLSVLAVALGGIALVRLVESRDALLDTAAPAADAAERLALALLDQETGVRGFSLSGRPEFLDPYREGRGAQQSAVATLRDLAGPDAAESEVDAVERAVESWRSEFAEPLIAAVGGTGVGPDPQRGRELFDAVRAASSTVQARVLADLAVARARVGDAAMFLAAVGAGIAAVLVAFLVAAGTGLRRAVLVPVSQLAAQVRDVVSGDVAQQVRGTGPREIVELGADVESMRVHILRELDTLQQVNRRLDEQARDLERSNRDLEQFAYVAGHDLQEPLRKVSSFCQLLARRYGGRLDDRADQYIEFAVDGAQRMQQLINDLLAFSRVGRTTAGFTPVDLGVVAKVAAGRLEAVRAEGDGRIEIAELPEVPGDRSLLDQLLANLLGNGLKFHRAGVPPVVTVTARPDGLDSWEIAVTDNGIGIEPEYADKIFVLFQRLHGRGSYPGTGIGLALAKRIVEFHGGRIWLGDPPPGGGTTIRFTLPTTPQESP